MTFSGQDARFMQRALELARGAKGGTFPNPAVGAVVVAENGEVVGEGATGVCGGPHAEKRALKGAGVLARGGTMYVTLEPCAHFGRTPPCAGEIIKAGVVRVIAAVKDPNPLVCGKGIRQLRAHGVDVRVGLMRREAEAVNEDFFWAVTKKRPWVTLKLAMTLDGRIADFGGGSKWITSPESRRVVQDIRRCHSAVAVGKNTLLCDDPKLTARCGRKTYYPARIVFSSDAEIPPESYFFTHAGEARSILVVRGGRRAEVSYLKDGGSPRPSRSGRGGPRGRPPSWLSANPTIEVWNTGSRDYVKSIDAFLGIAYNQGLTSILIEGGQGLAGSFLEHGFVNKLHLFYGNKIFGGGKNGIMFRRGLPVAGCLSLKNISCRSLGDDFLVSGYAGDLYYNN